VVACVVVLNYPTIRTTIFGVVVSAARLIFVEHFYDRGDVQIRCPTDSFSGMVWRAYVFLTQQRCHYLWWSIFIPLLQSTLVIASPPLGRSYWGRETSSSARSHATLPWPIKCLGGRFGSHRASTYVVAVRFFMTISISLRSGAWLIPTGTTIL
jgi:hypothetical protein